MKRKTVIRTVLSLLMVAGILCSETTASATSIVPYDSYNYDARDYIVFTPAPYIPDGSITGSTLGVGKFSNPQDICLDAEGNLYVADTGNNRIVILDASYQKVLAVIDSFDNNGAADSFKQPYGVFVSEKNELYIADSENRRVVVLRNAVSGAELVKIIENPQSEILEDGFTFTPQKVTVDYADRVYVVAKGVTEGIMVFSEQGEFTGYFGTINVTLSLWEKFWRKISTKEERSKQKLYIATEFTGLDIDDDGFVYATNKDSNGVQAVRRLNPRGQDVTKKGENKNVGGDINTAISTSLYGGVSVIVDVVVREKGIYSLLDTARGRIFTYDHEGNLLYIFGGLGSQTGTFQMPAAIEATDTQILVLDATRAEILLFKATEYGSLINEAVGLRYDGDEILAVEKWHRVLELNENFELANVGIGKAYLSAGDNKTAMKYLKLGMDRQYYSIAFKRYRNEILREYLGYILTGVVVLVAAVIVVKKVRKRRKGGEADE